MLQNLLECRTSSNSTIPDSSDTSSEPGSITSLTAWDAFQPGGHPIFLLFAKLEISVEGMSIPVLSLEDLIKNKENTGREKDALDAKMLKKRLIPNQGDAPNRPETGRAPVNPGVLCACKPYVTPYRLPDRVFLPCRFPEGSPFYLP